MRLTAASIIYPVSQILNKQFEQLLLKNSLFRIKLLCIALTVIKIIYTLNYLFNNNLNEVAKTVYYEVYSLSVVTVLFFLLTYYFSKKKNNVMLWFMCYFFIIYYFAYAVLNMISIGEDIPILYLFSVTIFVSVFIPDFKPRIFILSSILFYLVTTAILIYHKSMFVFEGTQEFITFMFISVMTIKIMYYNNKVNVFINSCKIKELNNNLEEIVQRKTKTVLELQNTVMETMAELVEKRDDTTGGHIIRTSKCLEIFIKAIIESGLYKKHTVSWNIEQIILSAQLHDVGKIAISDSILCKTGKLTDDEFEEMKKHTTIGNDIINRIKNKTGENDFLNYAGIFVLYHHEKWNGTGYPYGLSGNNIPIQARIMAIIDVYDALISERPYKKPFSHEEAVAIIRKESGSHFDPELIKIFVNSAEQLSNLFV
jgi:HD-GYP domain-containing protein (c-di-GMP phosphodiesterase class II)